MSMLTPPGMGGQYRITGDKYPRMRPPRRRGRLVVVGIVSVAVLGVVGWGTLQLVDVFTGNGDKAAADTKAACAQKIKVSPSAAAAVLVLPKPAQITVNVFNATPRSGLAKQTADELAKRGFHIGEVGNASKEFDKKIKGTGILLGPASALNTSLPVLAVQLPDAEHRTDAARKGTDLDLIVGDGFKNLTQRTAADQALVKLTNPEPTATTKKSC